ncbi:MAG TPA: VCBS repeat-containing protein, partial [Kofleriaceae bacterium]
ATHEIFEAMAHPNVYEPGWREVGDPCETLPPWLLDGYVVPRVYSNRSCGCVTTEGLGLGEKDFNGDGLPDILWHNPSNGQLSVWSVGADYKVASSASLDWTVTGTQWIGRGTGDFNGDRKPDVLWHNATTGQVVIWLMNGTNVAVNQIVDWTVTGTAWQLRGTGDFNRDGKLDLVWHNAGTGEVAFWYLDGAAHVIGSALASQTSVGTSPILSGTGDFDNDGYSDLLWHNPTTGAINAWLMNGATVRATELSDGTYVGNEWHLMGTQDFDDDGLVDLMWHNSVTGQVGIWKLSGLRVTSYQTLDWTAVYPWKIISR